MSDDTQAFLEEARELVGRCQELKQRVGAHLLEDGGGAGPSAAGWGGAVPPSRASGGSASANLMKDLSQALTEASEALNRVISAAVKSAGRARTSMPTMLAFPKRDAPPSAGAAEGAGGGATPPGGATAAAGPAADPGALVRELALVKRTIDEEGLVIDRRDLAFVDKAPELVGKLGGKLGEGGGEAGGNPPAGGEASGRILVDCVRFMDNVEREYGPGVSPALSGALSRLRSRFADYLERSLEIRFVPDPRSSAPLQVGDEVLPTAPQSRQIPFPSEGPPGRVLALFKRGVTRGDRSEPPELLVSLGRTSEAFAVVDGASKALLRPMNEPFERKQAKADAFRQIRRKYLPILARNVEGGGPAQDAASQTAGLQRAGTEKSTVGARGLEADDATVVRYVANLMQPLVSGRLGTDMAVGEAPRDEATASAVGALVAYLGRHGVKPFQVRLGVPFDESFGTTRFDRRFVPSRERPGMVVEVLQMGFVNREGVPVQKAILGVSGP